ncbi:MAG: beta-L-arabinofuranosidase domain-containing protein [Terracidiphilus sp.]
MNRRNFVRSAALLPLALRSKGLALAATAQGDGPSATVSATPSSSPLRDRYELTLNRVLHGDAPSYSEEFILADVRPTAERRFTEYSGDVSGRYVGALATALRVYGANASGTNARTDAGGSNVGRRDGGIDAAALDALVDKIITLQKPDGSFGSGFHYERPGDLDMALLWGNGRLLVGLLEYYQLRNSQKALDASRRIGDFLLRIGPLMFSQQMRDAFGAQHFASSYICWTQQTEGLANLYAVTRDERYRKLAEEIAAVIERRAGDHVHGYLTSLRGVMDLYLTTGNVRLLQQCQQAWTEITQSKDLLITGGVPEGWSPNNHRTEGCGEADWVRLNLALWHATADPKYLAMAERAIFNELAFNQYATGDFGHRVYTDTGLPAAGAVRAWWCCTLHGLRCFPDIHASVFRNQQGAIAYDLPLDGVIKTDALSLRAQSSLAQNGTVRITVTAAGKAPATLVIRKPEWAESISVAGSAANGSRSTGGLITLNRSWATDDIIDLAYTMRLRPVAVAENRRAFWYGPWLLGAPASGNASYFNELTTQNRLLGEAESSPAGARRHAFSVPAAAASVRYAQAEYPDQPGTVQLRAIAEQTGQATTSWELRFLAGKNA